MDTITIYFMTKPSIQDPIFEIGFMTPDGKRLISALWDQDGQHYVLTGSKTAGTLKRYNFTEHQEKELENFCLSTASNKEYWEHPIL